MAAASASMTDHAARRFVERAMTVPLLEADEEHHLATRWRDDGDERALHTLITAYMRLVISMAGRFRHYGLSMTDLIQEGNIGLMQAAERFDPERGVRFSTYASWWIRSSIQDFVLRNWSIVRTGTTAAHKSLFFNLRRLRAMIDDIGEGSVTPDARAAIASKLNVSERDVDTMAARLSVGDRSLNTPVGEDGETEWQDTLSDDDAPSPEERVMTSRDEATRARWLAEALETLNPREQFIVRKRRLDEDALTLDALGKELGISKERVRQIEHKALEKLKNSLVAAVGDPARMGVSPAF